MKLTTIKYDSEIALEGDIVSEYDDNRELTGIGYENMIVLDAPNLTLAEFNEEFKIKKAKKREYEDGKKEWKKNGIWYEIIKEPKYSKNVKGADKDQLKNADKALAKTMVGDFLRDTVELYSENVTVESIE